MPNLDKLLWNIHSWKYGHFSNNNYYVLNKVTNMYTLYDYNFVQKQLYVKNHIKKFTP